jgi:hypothetical protein
MNVYDFRCRLLLCLLIARRQQKDKELLAITRGKYNLRCSIKKVENKFENTRNFLIQATRSENKC